MTQPDPTVGPRVENLRRARGLSRERLASLAGVSASTVKFVETGRRALTLSVAQKFAPLLGVTDLADLFGPTMHLSLDGRPSHPAVSEVRRALTAWPLRVDGEPQTPDYLQGALDAAWRTWHTSPHQRTEAGAVLPGLITEAQRAARLHQDADRRRSQALLAEVYHLTQAYLAWHGERELLWLTVDRGLSCAADADDPLALAWSVFYAAALLRAVGRADEAVERLTEACQMVEPMLDSGGTEPAATLASLRLCSALTRARAGDQSAWHDWQQARDVVHRLLPDRYVHRRHPVSRPLLDVYATMCAVELGNPDEAQRHAHSLDPESIPSTVWRASHYLSLARGADQEGSREGTLDLLQRAARTSNETVQYSPAGRELVGRLLAEAGATIRGDVVTLARLVGVD